MKTYTIVAGVNGTGKSSLSGVLKAERSDLECRITETTLSGSRAERVIAVARERGYFIRLFYIGLNSCEESIKRIKNRVEKGGHGIDSNTVRTRFDKRFDSLTKILPLCNEAYFYDNENGFAQVAEYKNGEIIFRNGAKPQWLDELCNHHNK